MYIHYKVCYFLFDISKNILLFCHKGQQKITEGQQPPSMEYVVTLKPYLIVGINIGIVKQMTETMSIAVGLAAHVDTAKILDIHGITTL